MPTASRASSAVRPPAAAIVAVARATMSVSVKPGQTAFTVIPSCHRLQAQCAAEADQRVLGRDVSGDVGVTPQAGGAGDVDDAPEAAARMPGSTA